MTGATVTILQDKQTTPLTPPATATGGSPLRLGRMGGVGLAVLSSAAFGSSGSFATSLMHAGWSPSAVVAVRVSIAALVLAVPGILAMRGQWNLLWRNARSVSIFGLIGVAGCQVAYFQAVERLSVSVALLLEYSGILLIVAWQWLRHGQKPRRLTIGGAALAILGLAFVLDLFGAHHLDPVGVLWGLVAAVFLAIYFFIAGDSDENLPAVTMSGASMLIGAVTLLVLGAVGFLPMHATTNAVTLAGTQVSWVVPVLGISVIAAALAYVLGIAAVRKLGVKLASFVSLVEVLFAVLFAWVLLDQVPTWIQGVGGVLVVAGVALVRADEMKDDSAPDFGPEPLATLET
jgi:drug/metabolite transporter (DMT)-like permease